jgi:hypothetical protein
MTSIERRYRRLILAYPKGPRREELLHTLLELAPPNRRHPTVRDVANILRYGVRARLGRPRSRSIVVLATLTALITGGFGAAAGSLLGWQFAPGLEGAVDRQGIGRTVFPGMAVKSCADDPADFSVEHCAKVPAFVWNPDHEGKRFGYLEYGVTPTPATRDHIAYTNGVRERLIADGWRMGSAIRVHQGVDDLDTSMLDGTSVPGVLPDFTTNVREATFWATRGDLVLEFFDATGTDDHGNPDPEATARFTIARSAPWWLWVMTAAGTLLGVPAGWLLTGWISRRTEVSPMATLIAAAPAWLVALPLTVGVLPLNDQVGRPWDEGFFVGLYAKLAPWPDLGFDTINPIAGMALCALAPALLTAVTARRPRH